MKCEACNVLLAKRVAALDDVMIYCPKCRRVYGEDELKKKRFIYHWACKSGNQYYVHADNVKEAKVTLLGKTEIPGSDKFFIHRFLPQGKWCRPCVKDKEWPPYKNEYWEEKANG